MLIPSIKADGYMTYASLSRRVNANSQHVTNVQTTDGKLIKKGEC